MDVVTRRPLPDAFDPHKERDGGGLSVFRLAFHTTEEVSNFRTMSPKSGWVARLRASSIIALGLTIIPDPLEAADQRPAQPGHSVVPELNSANRKSSEAAQWKQQLAAAVIAVDGPFPPPQPRDNPSTGSS